MYRDPAIDFPYNTIQAGCMNTVVGRTLYRLFVDNLIVSSISFHGGPDTVAHCWGSTNHQLNATNAGEPPDYKAF